VLLTAGVLALAVALYIARFVSLPSTEPRWKARVMARSDLAVIVDRLAADRLSAKIG